MSTAAEIEKTKQNAEGERRKSLKNVNSEMASRVFLTEERYRAMIEGIRRDAAVEKETALKELRDAIEEERCKRGVDETNIREMKERAERN